jgi:hypothetical protein
MSEPILMDEKGRNPDGTFKEGWKGGPGRPKKKSFRDYFTEEEETELIEKIKAEVRGETRPDIIKMVVEQIFGKAKQPLVGGDTEDNPIKLLTLNALRKNDSDNKDSEPDQED